VTVVWLVCRSAWIWARTGTTRDCSRAKAETETASTANVTWWWDRRWVADTDFLRESMELAA
jgi:hypothetical protein